jgi:hypothetical protein
MFHLLDIKRKKRKSPKQERGEKEYGHHKRSSFVLISLSWK